MNASTERITAAVLIIGDEILSGRTQDTNLTTIAKYLATFGVDVAEARVVPDVHDEIIAALNALRAPGHGLCDHHRRHRPHPRRHHGRCRGRRLWRGALRTPSRSSPASRRRALGRRHHPGQASGWQRIPEGGSLVANPTAPWPPGFQIGNVFVLAGVPKVMAGMLEDIGWRLKTGTVVTARNLRVDGFGEGVIAAPLESVALAHPDLSLGSYPFFGPEGFGANLVVRGRDATEVEAAVDELATALIAAGIDNITTDQPGGAA